MTYDLLNNLSKLALNYDILLDWGLSSLALRLILSPNKNLDWSNDLIGDTDKDLIWSTYDLWLLNCDSWLMEKLVSTDDLWLDWSLILDWGLILWLSLALQLILSQNKNLYWSNDLIGDPYKDLVWSTYDLLLMNCDSWLMEKLVSTDDLWLDWSLILWLSLVVWLSLSPRTIKYKPYLNLHGLAHVHHLDLLGNCHPDPDHLQLVHNLRHGEVLYWMYGMLIRQLGILDNRDMGAQGGRDLQ